MIKSIIILNKHNIPELVFSNSNSPEKEIAESFVHNLAEILQIVAKSFDSNLDFFQIGAKHYYYTLDRISGTKFILETETKAKQKKINKAAKKIKNIYINEFTSTMLLSDEEIKARKRKIKEKYKKLFD
jgi:hypothetical protein